MSKMLIHKTNYFFGRDTTRCQKPLTSVQLSMSPYEGSGDQWVTCKGCKAELAADAKFNEAFDRYVENRHGH